MGKINYIRWMEFPLLFIFLVLVNCERAPTGDGHKLENVTLKGMVFEAETQIPVAGARVELLIQGLTDSTNAAGFFQFDSLKPGSDSLRVSVYNYDDLMSEVELDKEVVEADYHLGVPPCGERLVEDTNRVYEYPYTIGYEPNIGSSTGLYIRFDPASNDTALMRAVAADYGLELKSLEIEHQQWASLACIKDGRRPEYYFTPFGKSGYCNFATEPIVEYCFGLFDGNIGFYSGELYILFKSNLTQVQIDSFAAVNGLRFQWVHPDQRISFVVTRNAKLNVADLSLFLWDDLLTESVLPNYGLMNYPFICKN